MLSRQSRSCGTFFLYTQETALSKFSCSKCVDLFYCTKTCYQIKAHHGINVTSSIWCPDMTHPTIAIASININLNGRRDIFDFDVCSYHEAQIHIHLVINHPHSLLAKYQRDGKVYKLNDCLTELKVLHRNIHVNKQHLTHVECKTMKQCCEAEECD